MRSKLAAIAVALASSTCCPSLFLSVQKGKPAPRMPMPDPVIAEVPIPTPAYLRNGFLAKTADESARNTKRVLDAQIDQFSGYTDMPRDKNQLVRALGSLEQLEDAYGTARRPRLKLTSDAVSEALIYQAMLGCNENDYCDEIRNISKRVVVPNAQDRLDAFDAIEKAHAAEQASAALAACKAAAAGSATEAEGAPKACLAAETANAEEAASRKDKEAGKKAAEDDKAAQWAAEQICSDRKARATKEITSHFDACVANETAARPDCVVQRCLAVQEVCTRKKIAEERSVQQELDACIEEIRVASEAKASEVALNAWIAKRRQAAKEADEAKEAEAARQAAEADEAGKICERSGFEADQVVEIFVGGQSEASYRRVVESAPGHLQGSKGCMIRLRGGIPGSNDAPISIRRIHDAGMPRLSQTMLSFVHFTDAQLRDPDALLGNELLSHRLDWLVEQSFEYNRELEFGTMYIMQSLIATINREIHCSDSRNDRTDCGKLSQTGGANEARNRDEPAFVIHTGDAIDAGLMSELTMFHQLVDRLNAPFFNAVGNHDVETFGNLMPTSDPHSDAACAPVTSIGGAKSSWLRRLPIGHKLCVNARVRCNKGDCEGVRSPQLVVPGMGNDPITHANARAHFISGFVHAGIEVPVPRSYDWYPAISPESQAAEIDGGKISQADVAEESRRREAEENNRKWCMANVGARTRPWLHGFTQDSRNADSPAYYAFPSELAEIGDGAGKRNLISVVLDTEDLKEQEAGVMGRIRRNQMEWLSSVLDCARPRDLVIVFGHHAISMIQTDVKGEFEHLLRAHKPNVIAYFYGHDHNHQICRDTNRDDVCTQFWEIQTASLLEFPQEARRVKIKYAGRGMGFLEVVAFHENLANGDDDLGRAVARARTAAELDRCRTADVNCSDDHRVYRTDGHDTNARLWFKLP